MVKTLSMDAIAQRYTVLIKTLCEIAESHYFSGRVDDSLALIDKNLYLTDLPDVPLSAQADLLIHYGKLLSNAAFRDGLGLDTAQTALVRAKDMCEAQRDLSRLAAANNWLGFNLYVQQLFSSSGDPTIALGLLNEAYEQRQTNDDMQGMAETLFNIGLIYQNLYEQDEPAEKYYRQGLELAERHNLAFEKSYLVRHLSYLIDARGEQAAGLQLAKESLALREGLGITVLLPNSHMLVGDLYAKHHDTTNAATYYQQALTVAQNINDQPNVERATQKLAELSGSSE